MILTAVTNKEVQVKVIDLRREYPGFAGDTNWAVITNMVKEELEEVFADQLENYRPYLILSLEEGEIFADFNRNEDKHTKRQIRSGEAYGYEEGMSESVHEELVSDTLLDDILMDLDIQKLTQCLDLLPEVQRRRVDLYYLHGMTLAEVAAAEGVNVNAVNKSIKAALKALKEKME
ncbi:MAG: sigma factor-like helix-turn-helix DNA-binding protein [Lachnospiraceae bacterium]|nr:sigma factor-like helix-turn-helix DNA-binding protein [Lachnospiraceae bacterium]